MANEVRTRFEGDDSDLQKAFDDVGRGARDMAGDVGRASRDMAEQSEKAGRDIAGGIDESERKFRGFGDTVNGTGDIMQGFREGDVVGVAMGFADLAGGITDFVVPALKSMAVRLGLMSGAATTAATTTTAAGTSVGFLAGAMNLVSAHPLIAGIIAGGAIIVGLIALEKKFGLVTKAVEGLGNIFSYIWPGIKSVINQIIGGLEFIGNAALDAVTAPIGLLNKIPGVKSIVPDVPNIRLPRLHSGGVVGGTGEQLAILQAGERVIPRGGNANGGPMTIVVRIGDREIGRVVADALRQNQLIGVTI